MSLPAPSSSHSSGSPQPEAENRDPQARTGCRCVSFDRHNIFLSFEVSYQRFNTQRFHTASKWPPLKTACSGDMGHAFLPPVETPRAPGRLATHSPARQSGLPSFGFLPSPWVHLSMWPTQSRLRTLCPWLCTLQPAGPGLDQDSLTSAWAGLAWQLAHRSPSQIPISFLPLPTCLGAL